MIRTILMFEGGPLTWFIKRAEANVWVTQSGSGAGPASGMRPAGTLKSKEWENKHSRTSHTWMASTQP
jgi:hypothetical protein